jgi:type I restriction-modification system DNA methylase subunit
LASSQTERQQTVLNLLHDLNGQERLKRLFWTELNYDRANSPISRKGWGEQASSALADDPVLFATAGKDFHVIHARLKSDKLLMGTERPVVSRLLQDHPYALFVFSNANQHQWHFLNVKYDDDVQKRRLFRRITIGSHEHLRTASERLDKINLADANNLAPNTIQKLHDDAFDVEPVTREFFQEYGRIFDEVEAAIKGMRDAVRKHLFAQRLFNRLMFIAFIQKKGWLKFAGNTDYLVALWKAHSQEKTTTDRNFYRDRLKPLFFGLNGGAQEADVANINRGGFLKSLIGEVPYLNGGLFDEDEDDKDEKIEIPDGGIRAVLVDLFARFNFTVTESTPLDVEVAVDPEMLGKIFEELVTGRHETGSYYTPKPIVAFMCREALKGYLNSQLPEESKEAIDDFVDEHKPGRLHNAEAVLEALRKIKVCDPACGSGAYLVGMLHELLDLRACLFATAKLDARSVYERKLEIIQNNLYGVDLDQFAVNIARLRLWLSLSVDFEGGTPPPLPNLDYKVEAGDSICSPNPSGGLEMGFRKALIDEYLKAKSEYMSAHHSRKADIRNRVTTLKEDVASWASRGSAGFDWTIEFAEVFVEGGFDVVLANPPYVRQELIKDLKPQLAKVYCDIYCGTADLYCYFYGRGLQLLKSGGMLSYISSNKWLRANYGTNLRSAISRTCSVSSITDFGELPVFEAAATFPMVFVARKSVPPTEFVFTQVSSLKPPYPDVRSIIRESGQRLNAACVGGENWLLADSSTTSRLHTISKAGKPLGTLSNQVVYYGIKTGLNAAFVIDSEVRDELIREHRSSGDIIKPFIVGDNIRKWNIDRENKWLIFTRRGTNIDQYPAIKNHLSKWKADLIPKKHSSDSRGRKPGSYKWFEIQDDVAYYEEFEKPKIVFPDIAKESRFSIDTLSGYPGNTAYIIASDDLYLLAVLNSRIVWEFVKASFTCIGDPENRGRFRFFAQFVNRIPVPSPSAQDRTSLENLALETLRRHGVGCEDLELEMERRIARLFGLSPSLAAKPSVSRGNGRASQRSERK